jgi:hypothetical protein
MFSLTRFSGPKTDSQKHRGRNRIQVPCFIIAVLSCLRAIDDRQNYRALVRQSKGNWVSVFRSAQ